MHQELFPIRVLLFSIFLLGAASSLFAGVAPDDERKTIFPEDKSNQLMGFSLAAEADVVVTGTFPAWYDPAEIEKGAAYVFIRQSSGAWDFAAKLKPANGPGNASAGQVVDISGDVIVMGLPSATDAMGKKTGVAWVLLPPAGGWAGEVFSNCRLLASDRVEGDQFGTSVAIDGDVIIVGAYENDAAGNDAGAAYVFVKPAGGWAGDITQAARLVPSDLAEGDQFGSHVAIDGDVIVVSSPDDDLRVPNQGSAYVFVKPAGGWAGTLSESAQLGVKGAAENDLLSAVAIDGNTIVAGAPTVEVDDVPNAGAVYIFERPAAGWTGDITQSCKLVPSDPMETGVFGFRVAIHDDVVASGHYVGPIERAYVIQRPADGWPATAEVRSFVSSDHSVSDVFGFTVALGVGELFVSAPGVDTDFNSTVGAFYSYKLKPDADDDGVPDEDDQCPGAPDVDTDDDGFLDCEDNCPETANADQADANADGIGDACTPPPAGDACCGGGAPTMLLALALLLPLRRPRTRLPPPRLT